MPKHFPREFLYRIRNEIPIARLLAKRHWPHKNRDGRLCLICPGCREYLTVVKPMHDKNIKAALNCTVGADQGRKC